MTLCSRGGEYLTEITADAFYCPKDDAIVRGKDSQQAPGPDKTVMVSATCSLCGAKVYKTIYPDEGVPPAPPAMPQPPQAPAPQPELAKQVEDGLFPTPGTDAYVGTIQRPTPVFWDAYAKVLSKKLPPEMLGNISTVASLSWYNYLTDGQKQGFLDRFKETGILEVPDDTFDITRRNPKGEGASAMSGTERSAAALSEASGFARILDSPEIMGLAIRFWDAKEYDADYEGMHLTVRMQDFVTSPFEKGVEKSRARGEICEVRATVGGVPVARLQSLWPGEQEDVDEGEQPFVGRPNRYMVKPPARFKLSLYDAGYYSHSDYKSFVKHPSPVLAAAIQRILMSAPTDVGHISFKDDAIIYSHSTERLGVIRSGWPNADEHEIMFQAAKLPKSFIGPFWKPPVVRKGKPIKEIPVEESDLERIQARIDAKETDFNRYIEKLYQDDNDLAMKLDLSPVGVARLMGDGEYEILLKQRDELMWAEAPVEPSEGS